MYVCIYIYIYISICVHYIDPGPQSVPYPKQQIPACEPESPIWFCHMPTTSIFSSFLPKGRVRMHFNCCGHIIFTIFMVDLWLPEQKTHDKELEEQAIEGLMLK